ncbi:hypothetical protein HK098_000763 [Nowakowskiella sp. JEL0407]|nr:hypothetical protein HK098_000763 [Nowakowskiella sp. JEL0407]
MLRLSRKTEQFDRFVIATIEVCHLSLFKAAFLCSIIFEFLYPNSNQPYVDPRNPAVEDELWEILANLHRAVRDQAASDHAMTHLAEIISLLDGFEYDVMRGSMKATLKLIPAKSEKPLQMPQRSYFVEFRRFLALGRLRLLE